MWVLGVLKPLISEPRNWQFPGEEALSVTNQDSEGFSERHPSGVPLMLGVPAVPTPWPASASEPLPFR